MCLLAELHPDLLTGGLALSLTVAAAKGEGAESVRGSWVRIRE